MKPETKQVAEKMLEMLRSIPIGELFSQELLCQIAQQKEEEEQKEKEQKKKQQEEEEEQKEKEEMLRRSLTIWLLAKDMWNMESLSDLSLEDMKAYAKDFEENFIVDNFDVDLLFSNTEEAEPEETVNMPSAEELASCAEEMEDVLDKKEWLTHLAEVDTEEKPDDPTEMMDCMKVIFGYVAGVLTAEYSNMLLHSKNSAYSAEDARADFEKNITAVASSKEYQQLCMSMSGKDDWERSVSLKNMAQENRGEKITAAYSKIRNANRNAEKTVQNAAETAKKSAPEAEKRQLGK